VFLTVAICTRDRADQLSRTLESLAALEVPAGLGWELLIVDNGSTDHTRPTVASFEGRLPVRCIVEPQPGLSHARNSAVQAARGDYIVWTDDDVLVDAGWLAAYGRAFAANPECVFFGGPITPSLQGQTPAWFLENWSELSSILAERDFGAQSLTLSKEEGRLPFGANFAVRAREQRLHRFDPELGVAPGQRRLGEETAMFLDLIADGATGIYVPQARVVHVIAQSRQSLDYVGRYRQAVGQTWAFLSEEHRENFMGPSPRAQHGLFGVPLSVLVRVVAHCVLYALERPLRPSDRWLSHWMKYNFYRGAIQHWRGHRPTPLVALSPPWYSAGHPRGA